VISRPWRRGKDPKTGMKGFNKLIMYLKSQGQTGKKGNISSKGLIETGHEDLAEYRAKEKIKGLYVNADSPKTESIVKWNVKPLKTSPNEGKSAGKEDGK